VNQEESLFPEIRKGSGVNPSTLYTFCHPVNRAKRPSDFRYKHGTRFRIKQPNRCIKYPKFILS